MKQTLLIAVMLLSSAVLLKAQTCTASNPAEFESCIATLMGSGTLNVTDSYTVSSDVDLSGLTIDLDNNEDIIFTGNVLLSNGTSFTGGGNASIGSNGITASNAGGQGTGGLTLDDINTQIASGAYTSLTEALESACLLIPACADEAMLPVRFLYFKAQPMANGVLLEWATAEESNNSHFLVERSSDGREFKIIGEAAGAGDSQQTIKYEYTDTEHRTGTWLYRLRQVDYDNTFEYSDWTTVNLGVLEEATAKFSPNPATTSQWQLEYIAPQAGTLDIRVFNATGQAAWSTVQSVDQQLNRLTLNLPQLPVGVYTVWLTQGEQQLRQRVVVQ